MAPLNSRKRKSEEVDGLHNGIDAATPTSSPSRKKVKITQSQKQALIDNLQLEITERARHLRAHYALQSSDLRSRIERRINRIPMSLRKANMAELLSKYSEEQVGKSVRAPGVPGVASKESAVTKTNPPSMNHALPALPPTSSSKPSSPLRPVQLTSKNKHRASNGEINIASDKENDDNLEPTEEVANIKNPKRVNKAAGGPKPRTVSRTNKTGSVLSPRSHNSRTLPRSPIKDVQISSPNKHQSYIARPVSPLKPASPLKSAASAATSAITASFHGMVEHAKRGAGATARGLGRTASKEKDKPTTTGKNAKSTTAMAPPPRPRSAALRSSPQPGQQDSTLIRTVSQASNHSNSSQTSASSSSSSTTTVVKKSGRGGAAMSQPEKKSTAAASGAKTGIKKPTVGIVATGKKIVVAEPAAARRVLRKRT